MNKKITKTAKTIAQDILTQLENIYKTVRANDASEMFYKLRDFIKQTYLSEGDK